MSTTTTTKLAECLGQLQQAEYGTDEASRLSHVLAARALEDVWQAGRCKTISASERDQMRPLLASAITPIRVHVERLSCEFRMTLDNSILRKRSAVQFLIDDFGFAQELAESASLLDDVIEECRDDDGDNWDSDSAGTQPVTDTTGVPASHSWWTNNN
jgi:hypothetical protein